MGISQDKCTEWRNECQKYKETPSSTDYKITQLLNALEAAEVKNMQLNQEADWLAGQIADTCKYGVGCFFQNGTCPHRHSKKCENMHAKDWRKAAREAS